MAKRSYVGVDNIARKVKKGYVGIDNKARKIKKAYIGVGDIARTVYSAEPEVTYYGKAPDLSVARAYLAAASIGNYVLFAGGSLGVTHDYACSAIVDTYTSTLVKGTATNLSVARDLLTGGSIGNYALFAGGGSSYTEHC